MSADLNIGALSLVNQISLPTLEPFGHWFGDGPTHHEKRPDIGANRTFLDVCGSYCQKLVTQVSGGAFG